MKRAHSAGASATPSYRARELADGAGVTIKALLHYERLGLLIPARTPAGHRRYSPQSRERLRCIVALKAVGVPLIQMRELLDASPAELLTQLAARREVLDKQRERLVYAERALALVEDSLRYGGCERPGLSHLANVIEAQRDLEQMKRYFGDDVWGQAKTFYEEWPRAHWAALFRDVAAAMPGGPATDHAEALLVRWQVLGQSLWRELAPRADRARKLHDGFARAWRDRENWPETIKRRFADYRMNEVSSFIGRTSVVVLQRRGPSWFAEQQKRSPSVA